LLSLASSRFSFSSIEEKLWGDEMDGPKQRATAITMPEIKSLLFLLFFFKILSLPV